MECNEKLTILGYLLYVAALNDTLNLRKPSRIEEKVSMSFNFVSRELEDKMKVNPFLLFLLLPSKMTPKKQSWLRVGVPFMVYEMDAFQKQLKSHSNLGVPVEPFAIFVNRYRTENPKYEKFWVDAFNFIDQGIEQTLRSDFGQLKKELQGRNFRLIKEVQEDIERQELLQQQQLRQISVGQTFAAAYSIRKKTSVAGTHLGRKYSHRGLRQTQLAIEPLEKSEKTETTFLSGSLPLASLLEAGSTVLPNQSYYFLFVNGTYKDFQYLRFSNSFLAEIMRKNIELAPRIKSFLLGPTSKQLANGLKRVKGARQMTWENKLKSSGFRIFISQEKSMRLWTFVDFVHHDHLDEYRINHKI